jgi:rod shape-determining protein MreC
MLALLGLLLALPLPWSQRLRRALRDNTEPLQRAVAAFPGRLADAASVFHELGRLRDENLRLQRELAATELTVRRWQAEAAESRQLRELLGMRDASPLTLLACRVTLRGDISGWWRTLVLDRGAEDGVRPDMAVLSREGLVGRVRSVAAHTSEVLLLTDPACRVSCRVPRTGEYGVLQGRGPLRKGQAGEIEMLLAAALPELEWVGREGRMEEGYEVVTSGLGGVFPPDLKVGTVAGVRSDASGLCQTAGVRPAARLDLLRMVFVVQRPAGDGTP